MFTKAIYFQFIKSKIFGPQNKMTPCLIILDKWGGGGGRWWLLFPHRQERKEAGGGGGRVEWGVGLSGWGHVWARPLPSGPNNLTIFNYDL